ncbi:tRNA (N(6)-L-threonylcarbamoyladenosine(37)-C(2))-methylthiotransferase MtaB [Jiulongibacter sediminis]|uniref:Threonylcarbamoyladenosine tRNA methylthiotransferase MtaB n=1 Tax=Jiulongibacter sediminis TaxID=1605367 RepID=A0A0P7C5N0_9BACT|nr:tRNA (N(6)-L-threonylcarbamoyladenosine(37)-C(2))-methylthiotransferase MtaB [Jiulongibacter sediminis]KPM49630.1 2-methylthioadenine synthetase [Jiulongibacter sediminis]TBX26668.1 2-methylthioadenine synthetase [Jiulongibacter sediminis]
MSKKVAFYTLGCKLNYSETSTIGRMFEEKGYQKVEFADEPDIFIINTCSVTDNADKKCRKIVREAQSINPDGYVAILGCYAQLKPQEIAEIPGVDAVLGAAEKFRLLDLIDDFKKEPSDKPAQEKVYAGSIEQKLDYHTSYSLNDRTRTFLKVQDGCDYPCSYCTIPLARGKSRSDKIENIIKAAQEIAANDVKEIVLTGVNIGDFGLQNEERKESFLDLCKALDEVEGIERFRISSIEPNLLSNEIIEFVSQSKRFVPHFHIPLQSGSPEVLKLMKRRYKKDLYIDRVEQIKSLMPDCCIGVDVIVGHPGETEERFLETHQFLNELDISYLHVFSYSERPNTDAVDIHPKVSQADKARRSKMLHILSEKKKRAFYDSQLGREKTVLWEDDVTEGQMHGWTENYVRVKAKYDPLRVNTTMPVNLQTFNEEGSVDVQEIDEILSHTLLHSQA